MLCVNVPGEDYTVTFTARGTDGRDLIAGIGDAGAPYHQRYRDFVHDGWLADVHVAPECIQTRPWWSIHWREPSDCLTWVQMLVRSILTT